MKRVFLSILAVLAVLSIASMPIFADTNPLLPVIHIVVFNPSGQPISGANVYTSLYNNISVGYQLAKTNVEGRVGFNIANNTMYEFLINGTGFTTITGHYEFTEVNGNSSIIEYVTSNACHTVYTLKGSTPPLQENYTVTLKQTVC